MAMLKDILPPAKANTPSLYDHSSDPWFKTRYSSSSEAERSVEINHKPVPPYLNRQGFIPRKIEDFGDGGAFPEIHIAQYPLDMGRHRSAKPGSRILPLTVDAHGNVSFDAIVKQNENAKQCESMRFQDSNAKLIKEIL